MTGDGAPKNRTRVLVVDDSAFARKVLREVLASDARLEIVGTAYDGLSALEKIAELHPDVVTLDLLMPELDGVGVLRALRDGAAHATGAPPRVVVVTMTGEASDQAVEALQLGAFDLVRKPTAMATDRLYEVGAELRAAVHAAAARHSGGAVEGVACAAPAEDAPGLVVVGASTGGPRAVTELLMHLPAAFPIPIAVVLHMPLGYTQAFAERLDQQCALHVAEAVDGGRVGLGSVVIAPAGRHLLFLGGSAEVLTRLHDEPSDAPHRPSVDELFHSAARAFGARVLGVVLTGMGNDGLAGARTIREAGGEVWAESESTCVVYGMPRSVVEAGLASRVLPIHSIADALVERARGPS